MATEVEHLNPTVAIVGGGPAGLSAAAELAAKLPGEVLVIEREKEAGGIPRHSNHPGYGIRDRKSFLSGPKYAKKLVHEAVAAGARLWTSAQVTGWARPGTLEVTSPRGLAEVTPKVTILATGARERPRPARMVWGDRPAGIYTTGQLQNAVHLYHQSIGRRAVVVGAELVSWSAVLTLREAGCKTVALVSQYPKAESYALFSGPGRILFQTKVITNSKVVAVEGRPRVEAVVVENTQTGERSRIDCDTVVFTGDWIPDYELVWAGGIKKDPVTGSPVVDNMMRTSNPGVFAVGNLNHPVETADVVALEGRFVADQVLAYLHGDPEPNEGVELRVDAPLLWVSPSRYIPNGPAPARGKLVSWVDRLLIAPTIEVRQDGRLLASVRSPWPANPGRAFRIPSSLLRNVRADRGPVTISLK